MSGIHLRSRHASPADEHEVLALMRRFYDEDHLVFEPGRARQAVRELLAEPGSGTVLLLSGDDDAATGYLVLTLGFSLEQGGRYVLLDELYLSPAARGRRWGSQALALAREWALAQGARSLRLEVNHHNGFAKDVYLRAGYTDDRRDLLTLDLHAQPHSRDGSPAIAKG